VQRRPLCDGAGRLASAMLPGVRFPPLKPIETQAYALTCVPLCASLCGAKTKKRETVPRGSVAAEVAASSTEPTVEKDKTKKAKVPVKAKVQKDKTKKANAIRVVESEASSRVDGQTWKTFILRQGKTCLAHVSARKIGEVAAQSLVKMLKEKAENGEDKVAITHFKEIQMLRMKGL